jgi:hypothetical protein
MSKKWLIVYTSLALSACQPGRPVAALPPVELMTCAGEPAAPNLPERDGTEAVQTARDLIMLDAYLALRSAWGDCAAKLAGVREWREGMAR